MLSFRAVCDFPELGATVVLNAELTREVWSLVSCKMLRLCHHTDGGLNSCHETLQRDNHAQVLTLV